MALTAKRHSIKKGEVLNPNGRPKGAISKLKRKSIELREKAMEDIDVAYDELRSSMQEGESWAHQIYFKELVPFNKEWMTQINTQGIPNKVTTVEDLKQDDLLERSIIGDQRKGGESGYNNLDSGWSINMGEP